MTNLLRTILLSLFLTALLAAMAAAQEERYEYEADVYMITFPSRAWKAKLDPDGTTRYREFILDGDRGNGYIRVRKETLEQDTTLTDAVRREINLKLRFLPGFVAGTEERFTGKLKGVVHAYEYRSAGKPMISRIYALQVDNQTMYLLHFTGRNDSMLRDSTQADSIAQSFRLK